MKIAIASDHGGYLLKETVIYPGVIGPTCKFKTFHDFIN